MIRILIKLYYIYYNKIIININRPTDQSKDYKLSINNSYDVLLLVDCFYK